jgi:hypothetical protein
MTGVLGMLLGASPAPGVVTLSGGIVSDVVAAPDSAFAGLRIDADGNVYAVASSGTSQIDTATDWVRPTSVASGSFEVRATLNSGSVTGTVGSWESLSTDRTWSVAAAAPGTQAANVTIEIRYGSGPVLASGTYDISAQVL